jgi:FKBP-type peptidyl-prolyl cis-trans isomerase SlyD
MAKTLARIMDLATQIGPDTFVTLAYTLYDEEGDVLDSSDEDSPLSYLHGYGQIVPGLERAIEGMVRGNERSVIVSPEDGYGEYDPDAVLEIDRADFPVAGEVSAGDQFLAESDDGEAVPMTILEVKEDACIVDTNHPLAGETLRYQITVLDVRPATDRELADAERALMPGIDLIPLGRKPGASGQAS